VNVLLLGPPENNFFGLSLPASFPHGPRLGSLREMEDVAVPPALPPPPPSSEALAPPFLLPYLSPVSLLVGGITAGVVYSATASAGTLACHATAASAEGIAAALSGLASVGGARVSVPSALLSGGRVVGSFLRVSGQQASEGGARVAAAVAGAGAAVAFSASAYLAVHAARAATKAWGWSRRALVRQDGVGDRFAWSGLEDLLERLPEEERDGSKGGSGDLLPLEERLLLLPSVLHSASAPPLSPVAVPVESSTRVDVGSSAWATGSGLASRLAASAVLDGVGGGFPGLDRGEQQPFLIVPLPPSWARRGQRGLVV
jgi:hypothetical protein